MRAGLVLVHLVKRLSAQPDRRAQPSVEDQLRQLEEGLWRGETRFDRAHMECVLADDFAEVGRSGRAWARDQILDMPAVDLRVQLPLPGFAVRLLAPDVALVTYQSVVRIGHAERPEVAYRSSVWVDDGARWRLAFHQGTPVAHRTPWPGAS